ncbi:MAG: CsbD family protein [Ilumatobacter sp.]|nr:MAG: CsbD family protein [Ilumatobacter sp.]
MSGTSDKAKGRVKQAAGDLGDDDDLKREGKTDETAGKAKEKIDSAKDKASDAVDSVKDKFKGD